MLEVKKAITYPKLRAAMAEKMQGLDELGNVLGIKMTAASNLLSGKTHMKLSQASRLCEYYGQAPQTLFPEFFKKEGIGNGTLDDFKPVS